MKTYIALLRGINVSGKHKISMAALKANLEELNYENVQTYIQSGNVIFEREASDPAVIENEISRKIAEQYGFEVSVITKKPEELVDVLSSNPFLNDEQKDPTRMYVTFLSEEPTPEALEKMRTLNYSPEEYVLHGKNIYFFSPLGYGRAKMNNNFFEKKLKVPATTRNWKTVNKLSEMAQES